MLPTTQIVRHSGNNTLITAVELSILSHTLGWPLHVHAEGMRGTGKTTVLRSARWQLPPIRRIKGCLFNCVPEAPHCPQHRDMDQQQIQRIGVEWVPMPFLEISHSAKLGTVVGTIDLQRVLDRDRPEAALLPGTIAKAHRGIIFIDEINRLADTAPELVDVLLDVMGTKPGRLQIEESGLPPIELPSQVAVWAASNPDEEPGPLEDIRRQLSDRFDLSINVTGPETVEQVRAVLERTAEGLPGQLIAVRPQRTTFSPPRGEFPAVPASLRERLASIYVRFNLESLRTMEAWQWAGRLYAWRQEREQVTLGDLVAVAPLVLQHRLEPGLMSQVIHELQAEDREAAEMAGAKTGDESWAPATVTNSGISVNSSGGIAFNDQKMTGDDSPLANTLLNRVKNWLYGSGNDSPGREAGYYGSSSDSKAGGQAATPGSSSGTTLGDMPAPPHRARTLAELTDEEIWERLHNTGRVETR